MTFLSKYKTYHSKLSEEVGVGKLKLGGSNPVLVQSMTNTNTLDTLATVEQTIRLANAGCDIVRITAPGIKEAENLANIKSLLNEKDYDLPIVADIHFNPKAAEVAATYVEKVRINPGNYVDRNRGKTEWSEIEIHEARNRIAERLIPLLKICKTHGTAIRIGTNHGSLSERILATYGNTSRGMVESAMEFVSICHDFGFDNLVLSMKASNVQDMIEANILLVEEMLKKDIYYPIHLGVTEAGNGEEARIKSAAGIGSLLMRGIGDTIRVSLAEMPVEEVPFGNQLVKLYGRNSLNIQKSIDSFSLVIPKTNKSLKEISGVKNPVLTRSDSPFADLFITNKSEIASKTNAVIPFEVLEINDSIPVNGILKRIYPGISAEELLIKVSAEYALFMPYLKQSGIWVENGVHFDSDKLAKLSLKVLQGLGLRYSNAEFVACPSCGRTKFNLFDSFNKVKERTMHLQGLQIAVMGCIVNGPGEMGDADYGYVGAGPGKVTIYRNGNAELKNIDEEMAVKALINLIKESGDWHEEKP